MFTSFQRFGPFKTSLRGRPSVEPSSQRGVNVSMRKVVLVGTVLAVLATAASASGSEVEASASGGYSFSGPAAGSFFVIHPFTWNVQLHADGTVHGRFNYRQVRDGVELTVSGSLTCAVVIGNRVWVGGIIEESSRPSLIGLDMWFQAQDNGEPGADETPDMSSTLGAAAAPAAQQYCDDHPEVRFPFFVS